jgi:hypothetical protein
MIHFNRLFLIPLVLICFVVEAFGGGQNRAGTAAAPELRIPVGSRFVAMGGADVALVSGLEAIYWNPAGVSVGGGDANAMFSYRQYIADMSMSFAAVSGNFGDLGTIGVSFRDLSIGNIDVTTLDAPDGTGEVINPTFFVVGLTYSKTLSDRISIGANINVISESWTGVGATAFGLDFGVQYRNLFELTGLSMGVAVKNLGTPMKYEGTALWFQGSEQGENRDVTFYERGAQSAELPSEISLGVSYVRNIDDENKLTVAGTFVNNNYAFDDYRAGLEYSYKDIFFVRGGYLFSPESDDVVPNIFQNYSVGVGINFMEFTDLNLSLDYAYMPVKYFDANNIFSLKMGF